MLKNKLKLTKEMTMISIANSSAQTQKLTQSKPKCKADGDRNDNFKRPRRDDTFALQQRSTYVS